MFHSFCRPRSVFPFDRLFERWRFGLLFWWSIRRLLRMMIWSSVVCRSNDINVFWFIQFYTVRNGSFDGTFSCTLCLNFVVRFIGVVSVIRVWNLIGSCPTNLLSEQWPYRFGSTQFLFARSRMSVSGFLKLFFNVKRIVSAGSALRAISISFFIGCSVLLNIYENIDGTILSRCWLHVGSMIMMMMMMRVCWFVVGSRLARSWLKVKVGSMHGEYVMCHAWHIWRAWVSCASCASSTLCIFCMTRTQYFNRWWNCSNVEYIFLVLAYIYNYIPYLLIFDFCGF